MTAATIPPIEGKTTVNVPLEQAFTVFTAVLHRLVAAPVPHRTSPTSPT